MAGRLCEILPDPLDLLRLNPAELGAAILETLHFQVENSRDSLTQDLAGYIRSLFELHSEQYPRKFKRQIERAVIEAWYWLRHQDLIAPEIHSAGYHFITRRGSEYKTRQQVDAYHRAQALPFELVHVSIRDKVWGSFLRGDHDTAVFQAFKEVEVAVRGACGYGDDKIGVNLMRDAFKPNQGLLSDARRLEAEQVAERDLFAGAIGSYKNPQSHRDVGIPSAEEAAEMIIFASHLLRIVDARAKRPAQGSRPDEAAP